MIRNANWRWLGVLGCLLLLFGLWTMGCGDGGGEAEEPSEVTDPDEDPAIRYPLVVLVSAAQEEIFADGSDSTTITAMVLDNRLLPMAGAGVIFQSVQGLGELSSGIVLTNPLGIAQTEYTALSYPATDEIQAICGLVADSVEVTLLPVPVWIILLADPAELPPDGISTSEILATATDAFGAPVPNVELCFTSSLADTAITADCAGTDRVTTDVNGEATATLTAGTTVDDTTVEGRAPLWSLSGETTVDILIGAPADIVLTADPASISVVGQTASTITATVYDVEADPVVGVTVGFETTLGTIDSSAVTNLNGEVTVTLTAGTLAAVATVWATSGAIQDSIDVTIHPGPASDATSTLEAEPDTLAADGEDSAVVTATITDTFSNPISGERVEFSTDLGSVSPVGTNTDADGVATTTFTAGTVAGPATITASYGDGLTSTAVVELLIGTPAAMSLTADPVSISVEGQTTSTITASVTDDEGDPVIGISVWFETTLGTIDASAVTNTYGQATATLTAGTLADAAVVTATAGSVEQSIQVQINVGPASDETSLLDADPDILGANGEDTAVVTMTIKDKYSNPIAGAWVEFSTDLGSVYPIGAHTNSSGVAATTFTAGTEPGTASITASYGEGLTSTTAVELLVGTPAQIALSADPVSISVVSETTSTITALVTDDVENPVTGISVWFETTLGTIDDSAVTNTYGQATATLTAGTLADVAVVTATSGAVQRTIEVTIKAGPAVLISVEAAPDTLNADGVDVAAVTATVTDIYGNPVEGEQVVFSTDLGSVSPAEANTDASGLAETTLTAPTTAGTATVEACAGSLCGTAEVSIVAIELYLEAQPSAIEANGTSTSTITATLRNEVGNPIIGETIAFQSTMGIITASGVTDERGKATATLTSERRNGTAMVSALYADFTTTTPVYFQGVTMTVNADPTSLIADGADSSTITATLVDAASVPIVGETAYLDSTLVGSTIAPTTAVTDVNGQVTALLSSTVAGSTTVRAIGAGAEGTRMVSFSGYRFSLDADPESIVANGADSSTITIHLEDNEGHPIASQTIDMSSTLGSITSPVLTNPSGDATATLTSGTLTGTAIVTASTAIGELPLIASGDVQFVSAPAASLILTATPSIIRVGGDSSELTAVVLDESGNPVSDELVSFSISSGVGGGETVSPGTATTDATGIATSSFTSGIVASSTPGDIVVQAAVTTPGVSPDTVNLTIAGAPHKVSVGYNPASLTDNGDGTFTLPMAAIVTDINGNEVVDGTIVNFTTLPQLGVILSPVLTVSGIGLTTLTYPSSEAGSQITVTAESQGVNDQLSFPLPSVEVVVASLSPLYDPAVVTANGAKCLDPAEDSIWPLCVDNTVAYVVLVSDIYGVGVPDILVSFESTAGTITGYTFTDKFGNAAAILIPSASTTDVVASVIATAGGVTSPPIEITFKGVEIRASASPESIQAGENTSTITVQVKETTTTLPIPSVTVHFGTDLGTIVGTAQTDLSGVATTTFTAGGEPGMANITAFYGASLSAATTVEVRPYSDEPGSIILTGLTAESIGVRGSGDVETSTLTFEVRDEGGIPVGPGVPIGFYLDGGGVGGGEYLVPELSETDSLGQVGTTLASGIRAGSVRVRAFSVDDPDVYSDFVSVAIHGGLPYGEHFTLSAGVRNIAGLKYYGLTDTIDAWALDEYDNNVQDGVTIYFTSDFAGVTGSGQTISGHTTSTLTSQEDLPPDGFVTVSGSTVSGVAARILSIAVEPKAAPTDPDVVYTGTDGGGIFKSTDGGGSWIHVGRFDTGLTNGIVNDLAVDPNQTNIVYAATAGGLFRTLGGGDTWEDMSGGKRITGEVLAWPAYNLDYSSTMDRAKTRVRVNGFSTLYYYYTRSNDIAFYDVAVPAAGDVVTIDYITSATLPALYPVTAVAVDSDPGDPIGGSVIYAGTDGDGVYRSTNGGFTWMQVNAGLSDPDVLALAIDPGTPWPAAEVYAGTRGGGVFISLDSGQLWAPSNDGLTASVVQTIAVDPIATDRVYVGSLLGGVFRSEDGGVTWLDPTVDVNAGDLLNTDVRDISVDASADTTVYAATYGDGSGSSPEGGVFQSDDNGDTWTRLSDLTDSHVLSISAVGAVGLDTLYAGTLERNLEKSTDSGLTWAVTNGGIPNRSVIYTNARVLFSGETLLTILPVDDDDLISSVYPTLPYERTQSFIYTMADMNGNPVVGGSLINVFSDDGYLSGDLFHVVPDVQGGWTAFGVTLFNDNEGANPEIAIVTVDVTSENGNAQIQCAGVLAPQLKISPTTITTTQGSEVFFTATGGFSPYSWFSTGGSGDEFGPYYIWTASSPGTYLVIVSDSAPGTPDSAEATVTVLPADALSIDPASATVYAGQMQVFEADGASMNPDNYSWAVSPALGSPTSQSGGATFEWVAPNPPPASTIFIMVTDTVTSHAAMAQITVPELEILPSAAAVTLDEDLTFYALGGSGETTIYSWSATDGSPFLQAGGSTFEWTAPSSVSTSPETVSISLDDSYTGETAVSSVTVSAVDMTIDPETVTVAPDATTFFTASGGTGAPSHYSWAALFGTVNPMSGGDLCQYTAPSADTVDIVTVTDTVSGHNADAIVTVATK